MRGEKEYTREEIHEIEKKHYKLTAQINMMLLCAHFFLLGLFFQLNVTMMVYVNIGSIIFYICLFWFYKKNISLYVFLVFLEVTVHMVLAMICVGSNAGFQYYIFSLVICIFYCDYLAKTDTGNGMHPILISVILAIVFLITRYYMYNYGALYVIQNKSIFSYFYVFNTIIAFVFIILYLNVFEKSILKKEKLLEEKAEIDQLTQLPNRYRMKQWLESSYKDDIRRKHLSIAIMDIDDFKKLNDTMGHAVGDQALRRISECIQLAAKDCIKASRWGGEEFVFMAVGEEAYEQLYAALEDLKKEIAAQIISHGGTQIQITVTFGIAQNRKTDRSYEDILKRADDRLYIGKNRGKNIIVGH